MARFMVDDDSAPSAASSPSDINSPRSISHRMPAERSRCNNPQGRQKACSECAKAKRRCDLRQPSCLRCSRQKLCCSYPPQPFSDSTSDSQDDSILADVFGSQNPFPLEVQTLNDLDVGLLDFDPTIGIDSINALNDLCAQDTEDSQIFIRPTYLPEKGLPHIELSKFSRSRIEYSVEQWKLAPAMMVQENCTLWCHPLLYEEHMPRSLSDAHAACALYMAKTDSNRTFIARHMIDRAKELIDSPAPAAPIELVARAHAMILYLIIFVFSGDIEYYSQDEQYMPQFEDMGNALHALTQREIDPVGPLPLYPTIAAQAAWKAFIFRESLRRTMLVVFQFIAMYSLLRGRLAACNHALAAGHRITLSGHLWTAKNAFDFALAWNEKNHFVVKEMDLTDLMATAKPDDIDMFGKVIMTCLVGIDDVRGWYHTRGGTF